MRAEVAKGEMPADLHPAVPAHPTNNRNDASKLVVLDGHAAVNQPWNAAEYRPVLVSLTGGITAPGDRSSWTVTYDPDAAAMAPPDVNKLRTLAEHALKQGVVLSSR